MRELQAAWVVLELAAEHGLRLCAALVDEPGLPAMSATMLPQQRDDALTKPGCSPVNYSVEVVALQAVQAIKGQQEAGS